MSEIFSAVRGGSVLPDAIPWEAFRDGIELGIHLQCSNDHAIYRRMELSSLDRGDSYNSICTLVVVFIRCCADATWTTTHGSRLGADGSNSSVIVDRAILLR